MKYQKNTNLLDTTTDNAPRFITKKMKFMISKVVLKKDANQINK